jgi:hypothetical protein
MEAIRSSETSGTTQRTTRRHIPEEDTLQVKLGLNSTKCKNGFSNKIKPLHVSANDGHHWKVANTLKETLCVWTESTHNTGDLL